MANPLKGEVAFKALDRDWTLRLDVEEIIAAEATCGRSVMEMATNPSLGSIIALLQAGLQAHHPRTDRETAIAIFKDSEFGALAELMQEAILAAFPKAAGEAGAATARPRKPPAPRSRARL